MLFGRLHVERVKRSAAVAPAIKCC